MHYRITISAVTLPIFCSWRERSKNSLKSSLRFNSKEITWLVWKVLSPRTVIPGVSGADCAAKRARPSTEDCRTRSVILCLPGWLGKRNCLKLDGIASGFETLRQSPLLNPQYGFNPSVSQPDCHREVGLRVVRGPVAHLNRGRSESDRKDEQLDSLR